MMVNYRYRIREKLGEGGSGEVFLAEDTCRRDEHVAMKILHGADKAGAEALEAFQNEVSSLASLSHPNLVRMFDHGVIRHAEVAGLHQRKFFTMELIRGVEVLKWITRISDPQEKERLLEVLLLQTLSVLSCIHREHIVHFDLKPENLVLVGGQKDNPIPFVKLMDFGFSRRGVEAAESAVRGTMEYAAPELLKGEPCDYRIDLYSLGATFYHLLEGRCPFEAANPVDLAKKVLGDALTFSSEAVADGSCLRDVIAKLMAKDAVGRYVSAEEAARHLVSGMQRGEELFESYFGVAGGTRFVGRESELGFIDRAVSSLGKNGGAEAAQMAIVVSGPEGMGKTSLLREATKHARWVDLPVYELDAAQSEVPFGGIASVLPLVIADVKSDSEEGRGVVAKYEQLLHFSDAQQAVFERWGTNRDANIELIARFLVECSARFPFVVLADNAHRLDDASAGILRTVVRDASAGRILLLAAETGERGTVFSPPAAQEINLGELAADEVKELSASMLGGGVFADAVGGNLYSLYGGTPAFVTEALIAVRGLLPDEAIGNETAAREYAASLESKLPRTIGDFLVARYEKLGKERQLILAVLSCFQFPVGLPVVSQVLPFHPARTKDHVRFLTLDGLVETGEAGLSIRMKRLKDAVYDRIRAERSELHALISGVLEPAVITADFAGLQELAFQASRCDAPGKAAIYYEKAADEGIRLFATQRALQLFRDAETYAKASGNGEIELRVQVKYVSALYKAGAFREAIDLGDSLSRRPGIRGMDKAALFKMMGLSASRLGENDRAQEWLSMVLQLSKDPVDRAELRQELVGLQISAGHFALAEEECKEQLVRANDLKIDRLVGAIYTDLGIATFFQDRFDYAAECFSEAMKRYELLHDRLQIINAMNNIGNALSAKGDFSGAIRYWTTALKASQDYGTTNQQAQIHNNLGIAHYRLKKFDKAKEFYEGARSRYQRVDSVVGLAHAITNLGEVHFAEGEYEPAWNQWKKAKQLYAAMENSHALTETCLHLANVLMTLGRLEDAKAQLDEAGELITANSLMMFRGKEHYLRGVFQLRNGAYAEAAALLDQSRLLFGEEKAVEPALLASVRRAECEVRQDRFPQAVALLEEILLQCGAFPLPCAEANHLMGTVAAASPSAVRDKAIVYLKKGMDILAKEPVNELTWKLAFALARGYYARGQRERAKEFLTKTRLILQFFLSHITSGELRKSYLAVDNKEQIFATIDTILKT